MPYAGGVVVGGWGPDSINILPNGGVLVYVGGSNGTIYIPPPGGTYPGTVGVGGTGLGSGNGYMAGNGYVGPNGVIRPPPTPRPQPHPGGYAGIGNLNNGTVGMAVPPGGIPPGAVIYEDSEGIGFSLANRPGVGGFTRPGTHGPGTVVVGPQPVTFGKPPPTPPALPPPPTAGTRPGPSSNGIPSGIGAGAWALTTPTPLGIIQKGGSTVMWLPPGATDVWINGDGTVSVFYPPGTPGTGLTGVIIGYPVWPSDFGSYYDYLKPPPIQMAGIGPRPYDYLFPPGTYWGDAWINGIPGWSPGPINTDPSPPWSPPPITPISPWPYPGAGTVWPTLGNTGPVYSGGGTSGSSGGSLSNAGQGG